MTNIGKPFQGQIWWAEEVDYNQGWVTGTTSYLISDKVQDVRIETGEIQTPLRGISSPSVCGWTKSNFDPTLHVEWILQPDTNSLAVKCCDRTSTGTLPSLAFIVGANTDGDNATQSWWKLNGCVCKTFTISSSRGEPYVCTADFSVATIQDSSATIGDKPAAIDGAYASFNYAGSITWTGVTGSAWVTDSFDITVENNVTDYYTVGSHDKKCAIPGAVDITGSCDISLDDGGGAHWDEIILNKDISSLVIDTGVGVGVDDKWTLSDGKFTSGSIDINISGEGMMTSQPFRFKHLTIE